MQDVEIREITFRSRITVKMGILERLYYFASSEISQALLRRPWNYTAIWHTHMVACIKHMPQKSMGARRGNQGNHIYPDHCENGHSREIVLLCIVRNLASPSKMPMEL